jgi:hypothetical protein
MESAARADGVVTIEHGALRHWSGNGWMSTVWTNGRASSDGNGSGHSRDAAEEQALIEAKAVAERYLGDWRITFRRRDCCVMREESLSHHEDCNGDGLDE